MKRRCAGDRRHCREAIGPGNQRIVGLQRDVDRARAALGDQVEAMVEELAEIGHPAVEARRQADIGRLGGDQQAARGILLDAIAVEQIVEFAGREVGGIARGGRGGGRRAGRGQFGIGRRKRGPGGAIRTVRQPLAPPAKRIGRPPPQFPARPWSAAVALAAVKAASWSSRAAVAAARLRRGGGARGRRSTGGKGRVIGRLGGVERILRRGRVALGRGKRGVGRIAVRAVAAASAAWAAGTL